MTGPSAGNGSGSRIVVLDRDGERRGRIGAMLRERGHEVAEFAAPEAISAADLDGAVLVVTHEEVASARGLPIVDRLQSLSPAAPIVLVTSPWSGYLGHEATLRPYIWLRQDPIDTEEIEALALSLGRRRDERRSG
jgi:DNA-binding NtrC family response regulator